MDGNNFLSDQFEVQRGHLRAVAYRMLGSRSEAEDAVQETWLRLARQDEGTVGNLAGWLTTVIARVCLDMLRSRKSRREESLELGESTPDDSASAEEDEVIADSVGLAVLVVLETLAPAERIAFVLHDMFDVPFEDIAPIVERTPAAARQLASRARRRVRGSPDVPQADPARHRKIVEAFLAASREGNFAALLSLLDPDVVLRADAAAARHGSAGELRGAEAVAAVFRGRAQGARPALVDGAVGVAVRRGSELFVVLKISFDADRIAAINAIADPAHIAALDVHIFDDRNTPPSP